MKNILIVSTSRDNLGSAFSFLKDIEDVKDPIVKEIISNAIQKKKWKSVE